ncbi:toprim domain-containing protein [Agrobacterium pusense]|uniref:toprim domain-containing protein n=1 Tax=Agrobacterium pusense TaxID=648995 RepID=UPI003D1447DA
MSRFAMQVVGATDANPQGEIFADRLRGLSEAMSSDWSRLRPPADDWNEVLQCSGPINIWTRSPTC